MKTRNLNELYCLFNERKNVTKKAIDDLFEIMNIITGLVQGETIGSKLASNINCRFGDYLDRRGNYERMDSRNHCIDVKLDVFRRVCGLYYTDERHDQNIKIEK